MRVLTAEDKVVLYMRSGCHVCARVKQFLADHEIPFETRDVDEEPLTPRELWSLFNRKANRLRVPFIALNDGEDVVLGYDPLRLEGVFLNGQFGGWQVSTRVEGERVYDAFEGGELDAHRWGIDDLDPDRPGQESDAYVEMGDGALTITVQELSSRGSRPLRQPPTQHVSRERLGTPAGTLVRFGLGMSVEARGDEPCDHDGAYATAGIRDSTAGIVLGFEARNHSLSAVHERLELPGVSLPEESFSHRVALDVGTTPGQRHDYAIDYRHSTGEAQWWVDGECVYWAVLPRPVEGFSLCMGLSPSAAPRRGPPDKAPARQGATGRWHPWHIVAR